MAIVAVVVALPLAVDIAWYTLCGETLLFENPLGKQVLIVGAAALFTLALAVSRTRSATQQANTALKQAASAEYGRRTDRYTTGVNMLSDETLLVRIGGLNLLKQLVHDDPERFGLVACETIISFIRHPPHNKGTQCVVTATTGAVAPEDSGDAKEDWFGTPGPYRLREDVNEAVLQLSELGAILRKANIQEGRYIPRVFGSDIRGLVVDSRDLDSIAFSDVNAQGADLTRSNLRNTSWFRCDLRSADLSRSDLTGSRFYFSCLESANMSSCNLKNATIVVWDGPPVFENACLTDATINLETPSQAADVAQQGWAWSDMPGNIGVRVSSYRPYARLFDAQHRPADWPRRGAMTDGYGPPPGAHPVEEPSPA